MTAAPDLPFSMIRKAHEVTGWTHAELAATLGMTRPTVQAIIAGRFNEYLNARQTQALLDAVRLYKDQVVQGFTEMEMM